MCSCSRSRCKICGIGNASENKVRQHMRGTHQEGCKEICNTFWDDVWSCHVSPSADLAWVTGVINAHATLLCKKGTRALPPSSICVGTFFTLLSASLIANKWKSNYPQSWIPIYHALTPGRHNCINFLWTQDLNTGNTKFSLRPKYIFSGTKFSCHTKHVWASSTKWF